MLGTLPYMSPEQVTGESLDGRSDLYALGVVLYQLATGKLPFDIKSPTDAVIKHLNEHPPEPHNLHPGFPLAVENIILKALAKKPANRYQTGEELAVALRHASHSLASGVALPAPNSDIVSIVTEVHTRYPTPPSTPAAAAPSELPTMIHSRPASPPENQPTPPPAAPSSLPSAPRSAPHTPPTHVAFSARLDSSTIRNGGACGVTVQNQGQYPVSLRLIPRTASEVVLFDEWRKQLKVGAGQTETAVFHLTPPERPLLGKPQAHPFEIEVNGPGQRQALSGTLLATPYAPTWLLVLLVLMTLLLVVLTAVASFLL
jgi:serine/threonine protein kinase